jgi:hypothetical protein
LQQADLGGGISGGAGADRAGFQYQYVLAGASQQNRGHQPGDPSAHNDYFGVPATGLNLACGPRLFDSVA